MTNSLVQSRLTQSLDDGQSSTSDGPQKCIDIEADSPIFAHFVESLV